MATGSDQQLSIICDRIRALQSEVANLPCKPDRSATTAISELFCSGEGVLARLQQPDDIRNKGTKQRLKEDGDSSSEDVSEDDSLLNAQIQDLDPQATPDQAALDDPSGKGRLGVNKALEYLKGLETEIVSPFIMGWMSSSLSC